MTDTITITVDADTAKKYREATTQEREAYDLMLSLRLRMLTNPPTRIRVASTPSARTNVWVEEALPSKL